MDRNRVGANWFIFKQIWNSWTPKIMGGKKPRSCTGDFLL